MSPINEFAFVEVVPDGAGAFLLLYLDNEGKVLADTWHATSADAQAQAEFEFGITATEWQEVSPS